VEKEVPVEVEKEVEVVVTSTPEPVAELVVGMGADIENFDMRKMGTVVSYSLLKHINETLLFFDENSELYPILAESWEQIDDTTWRFYLREGVNFHDGTPFTADAVKYSLDMVMNPEFPAWMGFALDGVIDEVNVIDDYTVDVVTTSPTPSLLWRLTLVDIVEPEYSEKGGQDRHPIGTGPYKFVQYTPRQNFIMERNEDYWGEQPYFDRVEARILPEDATRLAALLAGEVQMINAVSPEMIPDRGKRRHHHGLRHHRAPHLRRHAQRAGTL
jgi:peptide/nickel transport system substrate-binding protein